MVTGILIYEDGDCEAQVMRIMGTKEYIDYEFRNFLDEIEGTFIQLTYVDTYNAIVTDSEGI